MDKSAIVEAPNPRCTGYVAAVAATMLITLAAAVPAHSGDFHNAYESRPYAPPYRYDPYQYPPEPASYYHGAAYRPGCQSHGCGRYNCTWRCGPIVQRRGHVIERRWVEREYSERRYVTGGYNHDRPYGYASSQWSPYPGRSEYPGPSGFEGPRPHLGYGGVQYRPYSASYEYDEPPRPPAYITGAPGGYSYNGYDE